MHHVSSVASLLLPPNAMLAPPVRRTCEPAFVLAKQESRVTELISDATGTQKEAHVVIKGQPFCLRLGLKDCVVDFRAMRLEASLLYDASREPVVLMEGGCPLAFASEVLSEGREVKISLKLKVLSSQYAGQYFVVRIRGLHPNSNHLLSSGLILDTQPIRVVSKPSSCIPTNQRGKRGTGSVTHSATTTQSNIANNSSPQLLSKVDELLEMQHRLLELVEKERKPLKRKVKEEDCVSAFRQFASDYEATPFEERPNKLRKIRAEFPDLLKDLLSPINPTPPAPALPTTASLSRQIELPWDSVFGPDIGADVEFLKNQYQNPEVVGTLNEAFDEWLKEI